MTKSPENDALALLRSCTRHEWMDNAIKRMQAYKPDWKKDKKTVFEGANIGPDDGLTKGVDEAPVRLSNEKQRITA